MGQLVTYSHLWGRGRSAGERGTISPRWRGSDHTLYQPLSGHLPPEAATTLQRTEQMGLYLSGPTDTAHEGGTRRQSSGTAEAEGPCAEVA